MALARDQVDAHAEHSVAPSTRRADERAPGPAIAGHGDPRLTHGGGAAGLLDLQRTAGNAAVSSLVAPVVQRVVEVDEMSSDVGPGAAAPSPAGPGSGGPAGAAPDGSTAGGPTTITGSSITLDAPVTQSTGIIRADTVIANSVVAENYTPGAGNVW